MRNFRIFALFVLTFFLLAVGGLSPALAQTADPTPPDVQVETPERQIGSMDAAIETAADANPPSKTPPNVDFDDPAIRAAIDAREAAEAAQAEADKALADAVREQMAQSQTAEAADGGGKSSLIPTNAEEAKALFAKMWEKVLGWLTSIKFLAQIGAIVLAYILAPLLARIFRKRVFLFRDAPAADVKLAIWIAIPIALIMLFGYFDDLIQKLDSVSVMEMGGEPITLMTIVLLVIFGGIFFKLGNIANTKGQTAIRSQEGMDVAVSQRYPWV